MRKIAYILVLLPFLIAGCQAPTSNDSSSTVTAVKPNTPLSVQLRREQLVGNWYGDQPTKSGGRKQWIMRQMKDGTFRIRFHVRDEIEGNFDSTEFGLWGVSAGYLVTLTRGSVEADGSIREKSSASAYFWDVYEIVSLQGNDFRYISTETKNEYYTKKVPDDFSFQN